MTKFQVPFDKDGNQWHFPIPTYRGETYYQDPYEFDDELQVEDWEKGRSRVTIRLKSVNTGKTYECTLAEYMAMSTSEHNDGKRVTIKGVFGFKKVGTTVSLMLI